ncbi:MAG: GNAT family N-acetyltransferase [Candidatus Sericytochromatia bacterium]|nr:GNAT family N-acetyltransferase [Candidatus Sericytochromatia bacterium]
MIITTSRLELIALSLAMAQVPVTDKAALATMVDGTVAEQWPPEQMDEDAQRWLTEQLTVDPDQEEWLLWYLVHTEGTERRLIGTVGFKGRPDADGTVELGYSVVPAYQRQGLATEAVLDLIDWALADRTVKRIVAETYPHLTPSIRVMEKCGMTLLGPGSAPGTVRYGYDRIGCCA